ncbi:MAG: dephospho-CoA kinase [Flavobacterium sp. BFFFF1]|uniref:dephospho-CoA kinase n=1 Tax=Flavobacterium sp. BFFFF1 TaxID=2015557 RepID=UPI000BD3AFF7|nr:dephospho-CoA kinase [Flavobacterium sp. BFFFF1]OYU80360.1 MAG: dephospho-CoA kinase [Flavobacterium sp. BFFFF1]
MTKLIGLTGGIGSGKSTVAQMLMSKGVPVYFADDEAKKILYTPVAMSLLRREFGDEAFTDGTPDRRKIANIVFNDPEALAALNKIIHPLVKIDFEQWLAKNKHAPFVVREAAILFESGSYLDCDKIISVSAPVETRIERVMQRDNMLKEAVQQRISNQLTDEERNLRSDYIIVNVNMEDTKNQVDKLFDSLSKL